MHRPGRGGLPLLGSPLATGSPVGFLLKACVLSCVWLQFVNVCGVSIGFGLSSACDTLMSQVGGPPGRARASPTAAAERVGLGTHPRPPSGPRIWEPVRQASGGQLSLYTHPQGPRALGTSPSPCQGGQASELWNERQSSDLESSDFDLESSGPVY